MIPEAMETIGDIAPLEGGNERLSARVFQTLQGDLYLDNRLIATSYDAPYDIRATAAHRGIVLKRENFYNKFAGLGVTNDGQWRIGIHENAVEGSDAERFLFGHELAHIFLLECMQGAIKKGLKRHKDVSELTYGTKHRAAIEHFCDYFAQQAEAHWSLPV